MGKKVTDIAQIRKYLDGELDARAMHQLERRAQDDPFLTDAMEGYQSAKADQQTNLDELAARLDKRVAEKRTRFISFGAIGIAASVLIICSAGVWWLYQGQAPANKTVKTELKRSDTLQAAKPQTFDKTAAKTSKRYAANAPANAVHKKVSSQISLQPLAGEDRSVAPPAVSSIVPGSAVMADANPEKPIEKDTTPLNEMIVMNYKSSKKKDTARLTTLHEVRIKTKPDTAPEQRLQANVPGVKVYPNNQSAAGLDRLMTRGNLSTLGVTQLMAGRVIQGKVIAENNGLPIQGASVKVSGTNQATKTDAAGFFKVQADTGHAKLEITNRGYKALQVNAGSNTRDSVKTIALAPDESNDLAETVVTGYTSQPRDANAVYIAAHPQTGWKDFKRYLKINAVSSDNAVGIVKVTFSVDKFGSISDIKIIKGLSEAADTKALNLVKDGPDWVGNSAKKTEKIYLRIKFNKPGK